jgi:hypothetical protein
LQPTSGLSNEVEAFADYVPTDAFVATKVESTLVHLVVSESEQTAMHDVRDTRDSAYPSAPATFAVAGGITVFEGWTNDRQPPSYFLGWVE